MSGERHDSYALMLGLAKFLEQRVTVFPWKLNVHQDKGRMVLSDGVQQSLAAGQRYDVMLSQGKEGPEQLHVVRAVLDNQYCGHCAPVDGRWSIVAGRWSWIVGRGSIRFLPPTSSRVHRFIEEGIIYNYNCAIVFATIESRSLPVATG